MDIRVMCRTCLRSGVQMESIFDTNLKMLGSAQTEGGIAELLKSFANVEVNDDARYPQNICTVCVADIERVYKFKLKCEQSDIFLRQQIETDKSLKTGKRSRLPKSSKHKATNSEKSLRKAAPSTLTTESCTTIDANCCDPEPGPSLPKAKRESSDENILKNTIECIFESDDDNKDSSNVQYEKAFLDVRDDQLTIISSKQNGNIDRADFSDVLVKNERIQEQDYPLSEIEDTSEDCNFNDFDENLQLDCVKEEPQLHTTNYSKDRIVASSDENDETQIMPVAGEHIKTKFDMRILNEKCSCRPCGMVFDGIVQYKKHFIEEHTQDQLCKICEKEFISNLWSHSGQHLWSHSDPASSLSSGELQCTKCGLYFPTDTALKMHETKSHPECLLCLYCSEEFQDRVTYREHIATHHFDRNNADFQRCNICSKEVKSLYQHRKVHSESRPFGCDICTHRFKARAHLQQHLRFDHRTKCKPNC